MSDTRLPSGDKEARSPKSQPMYLRASALPDPEPLDPVERCLFADSDECSTDASETCKARKKRAKLRGRPPPVMPGGPPPAWSLQLSPPYCIQLLVLTRVLTRVHTPAS